jgi:hypothetical protein
LTVAAIATGPCKNTAKAVTAYIALRGKGKTGVSVLSSFFRDLFGWNRLSSMGSFIGWDRFAFRSGS